MSESLLPPNATPFEEAVEAAICRPETILNATLWDPAAAPAPLLPWLAHSLSVDVWDPAWPEGIKRQVIGSSVEVHRIKGTRRAVRLALEAAGYPDAQIVEGGNSPTYDGSRQRDGTTLRATEGAWADYSVYLARAITLEQGAALRAILSAVAPVRCRLLSLVYPQAARLRNGTIMRDGAYSFGAA